MHAASSTVMIPQAPRAWISEMDQARAGAWGLKEERNGKVQG